MTVEVFDSLASSQGLQKSGWFAKIVKDKFNIKLNIIAPNVSGGDTVFDTRSASGNLGDLVIVGTGNGRLNKLVKAKLIEDMTPYYSSMKNVKKYDSAVKSIAKQAGKDGVWGVPQGVSSQSPTDPSEGNESAAAPYIRWDIYKEIGYPQIKDLDGLLNVLKQMQDRGSPGYRQGRHLRHVTVQGSGRRYDAERRIHLQLVRLHQPGFRVHLRRR